MSVLPQTNFDNIEQTLLWRPELIDNPEAPVQHESVTDLHKVELFNGRFKYDVVFVSSDDYRVDEARKIEVDALSELGDPPEEVIEEFMPYNSSSFFLLAYKEGSDHTPENMEGMMRVIPQQEGLEQKTLSDLAYILHKNQTSLGEANQNYQEFEREIVKSFMNQSGCSDTSKIWDISTFAARTEFGKSRRGIIATALITSLTEKILEEHSRGNLDYCLVFNEKSFHEFAVNSLKLPYHILVDEAGDEIKPIMYDTFDSGLGMVAIPSFLRLSEIKDILEDKTSLEFNIGKLATARSVEHVV